MTSNYGLEWKENGIHGPEPCWTVEPSVEIIASLAHQHLELSDDEIAQTSVEFRFGGAFNKLYAIECPRGSFFLRVTLPVDPRFKTLSETATIGLVGSQTSVPVPRIIASNASAENDLKFEWILMDRVPGVPLEDVWPLLSWEVKVALVKEVARILAQLFELRYNRIGNLFRVSDLADASKDPSEYDGAGSAVVVDRIVSIMFFFNERLKLEVPRGPFASSRDWIDAKLQIMEGECKRCMESVDADEDDIEDMERALRLIARLKGHFSTFFPLDHSESEEFVLHHDDVSRHNLIVSTTGELQGLVDWECVSTMPLWKACQVPTFIESMKRTEKPDWNEYFEDTLHAEHLDEYECTLLREIFMDEMEQLAPWWKIEHEKGQRKVDYEQAVDNCDAGYGISMAENWVKFFEAGAGGDYLNMSDAWDRNLGIER